jgi:hypothetical protein
MSGLLGAIVWLAVLMLGTIGIVFFVLAILRWSAGPTKYLLFIPAVPLFPVAAVVGWILFSTGHVEKALPPPVVPIKPPPPPGYGPP